MQKLIGVGTEDFDKLIRSGGYFVDKSELIYELAADNLQEVVLFTRPRRFGKTLTMTMLESFFDIRRNSSDVFSGLSITANHPSFCSEWMNQYPTLFISLKDVEALSFETAYKKLESIIADLCKKYADLEFNDKVDPADAEMFHKLKFQTADDVVVQMALKTIMRMLNAVYGKPVILLIDEYDVPLAKAEETKNREFYLRMLSTIRGLMSTSLKTNEYLKFAVVTGCLRISKESIFTGLNNFTCYPVTTSRFSQYFGFEKNEVKEMLQHFGLSSKYQTIRKWYDGYIFGNKEVFCPWDVASYISAIIDNRKAKPKNYWANTSSNAILDDFVNHGKIDASDKFETLLNGGTITQDISEELTYDHMFDSEKNLWSVLLMTGYVSKASKKDEGTRIKLRIPNAEIAELFKDAVVERFNRRLDASKTDAFITAIWNKDDKTASSTLSDILWNSISYFDYGEDYYHGMLNGIFTSRGFVIDSNDESGLGRLDLQIRDKVNRRYIVLECKRVETEEKLEDGCDEAISQVVKMGYVKTMLDGYEEKIVYGVAFWAKKAMVKLMTCP